MSIDYKSVCESAINYGDVKSDDVKSGDDLWWLECLTTIQLEGVLTFGELGLIMGDALYNYDKDQS